MSEIRKPVASVRRLPSVIKTSPIPEPAAQLLPTVFEPPVGLHEAAAAVLGMHWKTLEGMAREGKVPAFKVGKRSNVTDHAVLTRKEQHS